jgi:hypothetical protein
MTTEFLAPPEARPTRSPTLRKGWAQEMLARGARKSTIAGPSRAPASTRRAVSQRQPDIAASTPNGRRAARLTLPTPQTD